MKNGILIGMVFGMLAGCMLVNNSCCVKEVVDKVQNKVKSKLKSKGETVLNNINTECGADMTGNSCQNTMADDCQNMCDCNECDCEQY